jgi:NAD(P)H-hydrate epimerase
MKVATVEQMRELDRTAIERYGIPGEILMENAGEAVYFVILTEIGIQDQRFLVLCGAGHNGGDGLVVARKLHSSGGDVRVLLLNDPDRFDDAPQLHLKTVRRAGIPIVVCPDAETISAAVAGSDVVIDALLGTGIGREVEGRYRDAIESINESDASVVSIDIPSGVDGNTGQVWGTARRGGPAAPPLAGGARS